MIILGINLNAFWPSYIESEGWISDGIVGEGGCSFYVAPRPLIFWFLAEIGLIRFGLNRPMR